MILPEIQPASWRWVHRRKERGAQLAVFSELCLCGYPPQDLLERPSFIERNLKELKELAKKVPLPSIVGFAGKVAKSKRSKAIANKAALLNGGKIVFRAEQDAAADVRRV